eukprot:488982_1
MNDDNEENKDDTIGLDDDIDANQDNIALKNALMNDGEPITLNVGGIKYQTALSTLLRFEDSILCKMFEGKFSLKPSKDGTYFIDRDGETFKYILNYLRTGQLMIPETNKKYILSQLRIEADFYQISSLNPLLIMSSILSTEQVKHTQAMINDEYHIQQRSQQVNWVLLTEYQCTKDNGNRGLECAPILGIDSVLFIIRSEGSVYGIYSKEKCTETMLDDDVFVFEVGKHGNTQHKWAKKKQNRKHSWKGELNTFCGLHFDDESIIKVRYTVKDKDGWIGIQKSYYGDTVITLHLLLHICVEGKKENTHAEAIQSISHIEVYQVVMPIK